MYNKFYCDDCLYNDKGQLTHLCGPCEAKSIEERIKWWQDGKKRLKEKENNFNS